MISSNKFFSAAIFKMDVIFLPNFILAGILMIFGLLRKPCVLSWIMMTEFAVGGHYFRQFITCTDTLISIGNMVSAVEWCGQILFYYDHF